MQLKEYFAAYASKVEHYGGQVIEEELNTWDRLVGAVKFLKYYKSFEQTSVKLLNELKSNNQSPKRVELKANVILKGYAEIQLIANALIQKVSSLDGLFDKPTVKHQIPSEQIAEDWKCHKKVFIGQEDFDHESEHSDVSILNNKDLLVQDKNLGSPDNTDLDSMKLISQPQAFNSSNYTSMPESQTEFDSTTSKTSESCESWESSESQKSASSIVAKMFVQPHSLGQNPKYSCEHSKMKELINPRARWHCSQMIKLDITCNACVKVVWWSLDEQSQVFDGDPNYGCKYEIAPLEKLSACPSILEINIL